MFLPSVNIWDPLEALFFTLFGIFDHLKSHIGVDFVSTGHVFCGFWSFYHGYGNRLCYTVDRLMPTVEKQRLDRDPFVMIALLSRSYWRLSDPC